MSDKKSGEAGESGIDPRVAKRRQDPLGRGLQALYDKVVAEPVPDDFLKILQQAEERPTTPKKPAANGSAEKGE